MRCLVTEGQRDAQKQQERRRKTKREERKRKGLTKIEFTRFSYIDLKQIFTLSPVQATSNEISTSAQAPGDLIQNECPAVYVWLYLFTIQEGIEN